MDVNVDIGGDFVATKARISGGERIIRNPEDLDEIISVNVNVCLYKNQSAYEDNKTCGEAPAIITNVAGYNGTVDWLESKIPAAINITEEE